MRMIEEHDLCRWTSSTNDDDQSVSDFSFDTLFDIKCLVQKDDPELQMFVIYVWTCISFFFCSLFSFSLKLGPYKTMFTL